MFPLLNFFLNFGFNALNRLSMDNLNNECGSIVDLFVFLDVHNEVLHQKVAIESPNFEK